MNLALARNAKDWVEPYLDNEDNSCQAERHCGEVLLGKDKSEAGEEDVGDLDAELLKIANELYNNHDTASGL